MIQVPANATVVVMHEPINFRAGIDGIAAVARLVLAREPMDGALFVFRNRRGHMLRVLSGTQHGFLGTLALKPDFMRALDGIRAPASGKM